MDKNNITNTMTSTDTSDKEALLHSNENCTEDTSADLLLSPGSLCADGIFGDSTILPRLGDHYQVEIPSLMEESEYLDLRHRQINTEDTLGVNFYLRIGLAIPIMWVNRVGYHIKPEQEEFSGTAFAADRARSVSTIDNQEDWLGYKGSALTGHSSANLSSDNSDPHGSACNVETSHDLLGCIKESTGSKFQRYMTLDEQINTNCCSSRSRETNIPLPASSLSSWSDAESQGFLLGLYIFGKNLNQVKKFLESKEMGDVLSFYYGKFYRSDTYRRWSECRKIRSRRCIYGQRIFTGWRQQEVLSRILPSTSKEIQDTILEAAKNFNEGRASFEEFVFALKAMVGMKALVEAIGIGKGKLDLTGILLDPVRVNQVMPTRPEIPVGKACSSLTSGDIIKFLTGDFRLSKAKSNDLFWEAVWPRLLARGWHSEQPKDLGSAGSKSALVFLIPGVRKFSRKKLVKGDHYFDSVSDILNKVASDPMLLELEVEGTKGNSNFKVERQQDTNSRSDQNGRLDHQRTCYLRPKLSNCNSEFMKFTVVDTSLVQGEEMLKVRELRSLPMDAACSYSPSDHLRENNSDSSAMQSDSTDISLNDLGESDKGISNDKNVRNTWNTCSKGMELDISDPLVTYPKDSLSVSSHGCEVQCSESFSTKEAVKDTKSHFSCRVKSDRPNNVTTVAKRQRLTTSKHEGVGQGSYCLPRVRQFKKLKNDCNPRPVEISGLIDAKVLTSQGKINKTILLEEKPQLRTVIDLNLPHLPLDFDNDKVFSMELVSSQDDMNSEEPSFQSETKPFEATIDMRGEEHLSLNSRRQSTRNRPPTARALEALACGFLDTKQRVNGMKRSRSKKLTSRSSRRAYNTDEVPFPAPTSNLANVTPDIVIPSVIMNEECRSINHSDFFNNSFEVQPERKETHLAWDNLEFRSADRGSDFLLQNSRRCTDL